MTSVTGKREKSGVEAVAAAFADCKKAGKVTFIPFVTAGFKDKSETVDILLGLQAGGASIIELGVPFSDPLADGQTIEAASHYALTKNVGGVTTAECIAMVANARAKGLTVPVILMGYFNPFLQYGLEKLLENSVKAGIDGYIVVDLPVDDSDGFHLMCQKHKRCFVPLVAPTTVDDRMAKVSKIAQGYVYCVSLTGVTGARATMSANLPKFLERVRNFFPTLPLAVGFGISKREHVDAVGKVAEGAIMGSAFIRAIDNAEDNKEARVKAVQSLVEEMIK